MLDEILFSPMLQLGIVTRYSGVYLVKPDTVSDHTTQVGLIAITISNLLNKSGDKVDIASVALKCLVHDLDEAITCDIPRNVKYYSPVINNELNEVAKNSVRMLSDQLGFQELYDIWSSAKDKSLEGFIVKIADLLHVVKKVVEEIELLGNKYMFKVSLEMGDHLSKLTKYIESSEILSATSKSTFLKLLKEATKMIEFINMKYSHEINTFKFVNHVLSGESN